MAHNQDSILVRENSTQNSQEIISLMLEYYNNCLSEQSRLMVENLISNCEECQQLYDDVKLFFAEDDAFMYEFQNQKKIDHARKNFAEFVSASPVKETFSPSENSENIQNEIFGGWGDDDCFCCGG